MDLLQAIRTRRAVREFTNRPVSDAQLQAVIDAAIQAPSAMNRQPWLFVVVTDRLKLRRMSAEAKAFALGGRDAEGPAPELREHLAAADADVFHNAPALVLICATLADGMAQQDCCLAAENLMLAAHADGLGSCWIGLAEGWLETEAARAELGLPEGVRAVAPIIVGHPAWASQPSPGRKPPEIRWIR